MLPSKADLNKETDLQTHRRNFPTTSWNNIICQDSSAHGKTIVNGPSVTKTIEWFHFSAQQPQPPSTWPSLSTFKSTRDHSLTLTLVVRNPIPLLWRKGHQQYKSVLDNVLVLYFPSTRTKAILRVTRSTAKFICHPCVRQSIVPLKMQATKATIWCGRTRERMNLNSTRNTLPHNFSRFLENKTLFISLRAAFLEVRISVAAGRPYWRSERRPPSRIPGQSEDRSQDNPYFVLGVGYDRPRRIWARLDWRQQNQ